MGSSGLPACFLRLGAPRSCWLHVKAVEKELTTLPKQTPDSPSNFYPSSPRGGKS